MMHLAALLAALLGIVSGMALAQSSYSGIAIFLGLASAIIVSLTIPTLKVATIPIAVGGLMLWRTVSLVPPTTFSPDVLSHQIHTFRGVITNNPKTHRGSMSIIINQVTVEGVDAKWYGNIQAKIPGYSQVNYGDAVSLTGKLKPTVSEAESDSYQRYLYTHGIYGTLSMPDIVVNGHHQRNALAAGVYRLQGYIESHIVKFFPRDEAGLLLGIVLGLQQPLSSDLTSALSKTSTTHIIVASGYNASIILGLFLGLAKNIGRRKSIILALSVLVGYVALSGFNPSMIRAALMASIALWARGVGRQREAWRLLSLTALTMLIINPFYVYDLSFQLSFAATAGILALGERLSTRLKLFPVWAREIASTTVAAHFFTAPIIGMSYGSIAVTGTVANILILWAVPLVMALGAAAIIAILIVPWLGIIAVAAIEPLLWYIKQAVITCAALPVSSVEVHLPLIAVTLYYTALIILLQRHRHEMATV